MRFSPLTLFCEECGAANSVDAAHCFACHTALHYPPLAASSAIIGRQNGTSSAPPIPTTTTSASTLLNQRYKLIREVDQGGFGVVYEAWDNQRRNKTIAVKQINLSALTTREIIDATDSYNREVSLLSRLQHKNLPGIYDHFTDADHWYLMHCSCHSCYPRPARIQQIFSGCSAASSTPYSACLLLSS